jgi:EAL and modified HD-GYP domain-containing signal transduction protein
VEAQDATQATAQMLNNALNSVGLQKLVGKRKAFVNCNREMLLSDALLALDPERFVLEILEDVEIDDAVLEAVARLREHKFTIALDDFVLTRKMLESAIKLLPYIQIVKMDMMLNGRENWGKAAAFFQKKGVQCLAEKVETEADYKLCMEQQYHLFQGYYFARPEMLEGTKIDTTVMGVMQILNELRNDADIQKIVDAVKPHPGLTIGLLRYLNAASLGLRSTISSVKHAIAMVGRQALERWLLLLAYAKPGAQAEDNPLFNDAVQRAYLMEELGFALKLPVDTQSKTFLTGIVSRMDALCKVPLESLVAEFNLETEITDALLHRKGVLGQMLQLAQDMESFQKGTLERQLASLGISEMDFLKCQALTFEKASSLSGN